MLAQQIVNGALGHLFPPTTPFITELIWMEHVHTYTDLGHVPPKKGSIHRETFCVAYILKGICTLML